MSTTERRRQSVNCKSKIRRHARALLAGHHDDEYRRLLQADPHPTHAQRRYHVLSHLVQKYPNEYGRLLLQYEEKY